MIPAFRQILSVSNSAMHGAAFRLLRALSMEAFYFSSSGRRLFPNNFVGDLSKEVDCVSCPRMALSDTERPRLDHMNSFRLVDSTFPFSKWSPALT